MPIVATSLPHRRKRLWLVCAKNARMSHNRYMAELNKADAQDEEYQVQLKAIMLKKQAAEGALRDYLAALK
jgi:hypothetical protein